MAVTLRALASAYAGLWQWPNLMLLLNLANVAQRAVLHEVSHTEHVRLGWC